MIIGIFDGAELRQGRWSSEINGYEPLPTNEELPEDVALAMAKKNLGVSFIKFNGSEWGLFAAPEDAVVIEIVPPNLAALE